MDFTSSGLSLAARGVAQLIQNKGTMRLVASPALEVNDAKALDEGNAKREEILRRVVARSFEDIQDLLEKNHLSALAWLIARNALEVRLAIRLDEYGKPATGIYHEKLGIFTDANNQHVAFSGSSNETAGGLVNNFENIDVFWAWDDPQDRVGQKIRDFEGLWANQTPGVEVLDFTKVSQEILKKYQIYTAENTSHFTPVTESPIEPMRLFKNPRDYPPPPLVAAIRNLPLSASHASFAIASLMMGNAPSDDVGLS